MKRRTLLLAVTMLALALATFAGATFALFTDSVTVETHLKAGSLNVSLTRTNLKTKTLNSEGLLETKEYTDDVDFTDETQQNVFNVDSSTYIVPCSYFDAQMLIENKSSVAFNYYVQVVFKTGDLELANQLQITVDLGGNDKTTQLVKDGVTLGSKTAPLGMVKKGASKTFNVIVEFLDLDTNNDAQSKNVQFDLIVHAVQATTSA